MTERLDLSADLPVGRVTVEASAGTGKTYAIVGLATLFLAAGRCTTAELLVVTFSRSATGELRARLLNGLADSLTVLDAALEGKPPAADADELAVALCQGADQAQLRRRRDRLADALGNIDQATVSTIHAFAADLLARLGEGGLGQLTEGTDEMAADIAADLYLRAGADDPAAVDTLPFPTQALEIVRAGLVTRPADVIGTPALDDWDSARTWLAVNAGSEAAERKRRRRRHTHDDVLSRLAARIDTQAPGADRIGADFRVALVDEFQDTDPVQWRIFEGMFPAVAGVSDDDTDADADRTLVLVGDPKQAIYGFRGAEINAYVTARGPAADRSLPVNRRSDEPLVDAVTALFQGQGMGQDIEVPTVQAHHPTRLRGLDAAPVRFVTVADDAPVRRTKRGMQLTSLRQLVAADVAVQATRILSSGVSLASPPAPGNSRPVAGEDALRAAGQGDVPHPVGPGDIAVLVRTRRQAALVQDQLVTAGVPAVLNGVGNVMASPAARDWLHLLRALDRPSSAGQARLAAMTDLIGWVPDRVASSGDDDYDTLHIDLHRWRQILLAEGVAAAFRHLGADTWLAPRLLVHPDGDRRLTDLSHIAELLHHHASTLMASTAGLIAWLERHMAEAAVSTAPTPPEHLASRLERDDDAVQIMTVHGAKGLEFGIVLVPYLWDSPGRPPGAMRLYDPAAGRMRLYVSRRRSPDHQHYLDLYTQQTEEEERRLAYVAATRAKHHLRLWWAPAPEAHTSPLGMLLARPDPVATTDQAVAAIEQLMAAHPGLFDHRPVDPDDEPVPLPDPASPATDPTRAPFDRVIDHGWRRSSYTRLLGSVDALADDAAGAVGEGTAEVDTPPDPPPQTDAEPTAEPPPTGPAPEGPAPDDPELAVPVPLGNLRGGADIGTTVHAVLENLDFTAGDVTAAAHDGLIAQSRRHGVDLGDAEAVTSVAEGLTATITTPLDPEQGLRLADLAPGDRLDEMAFELPVLHGKAALQPDRVLLGDIAGLLETHLEPGDRLAGYAGTLRRHLGDVEMRGFLAGYVDLVARLPDDRYLVADYKTNRLAPAGTDPLTVGYFTPSAMAAEMVTHHYPLQALIYAVAVHRYLRWRVADYDPDRHLAGVAYLFVRGMIGPDTPVRDGMTCGVFWWRPPSALVLGVDALFADGIDPARRGVG